MTKTCGNCKYSVLHFVPDTCVCMRCSDDAPMNRIYKEACSDWKEMCKVVSHRTYFGSFIYEEAGEEWELSCGHTVITEGDYPPNYCPTCGTKVSL